MASMTSTIPAYLLPGVPVCQPAHLEGDSSLATEILPGPPSITAAQNSMAKRDPKKNSAVYSYLPASDPGTTYSGVMHGTWIGQDSRPNKRAKLEKGGASGRAQRASARNQNGSTTAMDPLVNQEGASGSQPPAPMASDSDVLVIIDDEPSASRSNSSPTFPDQPSQGVSARGRKKDKGKGREIETAIKVKEEPQTVSLRSPEPQPQFDLLNNNDHCSACRSQGALVYCDGCPRAFHLWCLDPPMESIDEGDSRWFCPACTVPKHPPRKPPSGVLGPLIQAIDNSIPTEYQLPDDIRNFFKDVGTSARGGYVDTSEIKPPRLNRHGQLEDRDAHRLRDRNGQPVLCFRCGTSALPDSVVAAAPATKRARKATAKAIQYEMWKNIISCDYCDLHWHLDCLDPPLSTMPSFSKKWMCPNHSEQIIIPKHRIAKQNAAPIEISRPGQANNGNIEVVETQSIRPIIIPPKVTVDEVLINGRRYRVPERIILLDFWNKISRNGGVQDADSRSSSPLTSLSSLDDEDISHPPPPPTGSSQQTDLDVAQMLWDFKRGFNLNGGSNGSNSRKHSENSLPMDADSLSSSSHPTPKPANVSKPMPAEKRAATKATVAMTSTTPVASSMVPPIETLVITPSASKRRRNNPNTNTTQTQPEPSARQLRSRSKAAADRSRSGGDELDTAPVPPATSSSKYNRVRVKLEDSDSNSLLLSSAPSLNATPSISTTSPVKPTVKRRPSRKKTATTADGETNGVVVKQENDPPASAAKRGKKRKDRDDEAPYIDRSERNHKAKEKREAKARAIITKSATAPSSTPVSSLSSIISSVPTSGASASTPATPSLKIRLPRMNALGSPIKPVVSAASSTRS